MVFILAQWFESKYNLVAFLISEGNDRDVLLRIGCEVRDSAPSHREPWTTSPPYMMQAPIDVCPHVHPT